MTATAETANAAASSPAGGGRSRGRMSGVRWAGAGLADQAILAIANSGLTLLSTVLPRGRAGSMLLAIQIAYFVVGINRAFVGEVLAALASRYEGERRDQLVRHGLATAVSLGLLAAVTFTGIWAVWPHHGRFDLRDLIWLAPFLPIVLLQDAARYSYLADRQPARALLIDLVWVGTQAVVVVAWLAAFGASSAGLLIAWGVGATASAAVFLARSRPALWRGDPRRWLGQTRHLSGWFTATALIGQIQSLAVGFLVTGRLSDSAFAGMRLAQTAILNPVQNFQLAVQGLLVPRLSRLAGEATGASGATATEPATAGTAAGAGASLRRQVRLVVTAFSVLAVLAVAVIWPVGRVAFEHIHKYADVAPLSLPIALQCGIYLVQVPFTAALRGMHRAKMLFAQYAIFTTTSLTGLVVGADRGGMLGATWGLAIGSAVGLVVMCSLYLYSLRWLPGATPAPSSAPVTADGRADQDDEV